MHIDNDQLFSLLGRVYVLLRRETQRMLTSVL